MAAILRLILGDQLNSNHSWFQKTETSVVYTLMEVRTETDYVLHHIQKILAFFAAMRSFRDELTAKGHRVRYFELDAPDNRQDIVKNLEALIREEHFTRFEYLQPDEYRLDQGLRQLCYSLPIASAVHDTEHFLTPRGFVGEFFAGKKSRRMEPFYREIRRKQGILMESKEKPVGGRWNFDPENRKKYDGEAAVPPAKDFSHDVTGLEEMLKARNISFIGTVNPGSFPWPATRAESLQMLEYFLENALPFFGTYQDAMDSRHPFLFHSRLSFALNTKMLHPLEVVGESIRRWEKQRDSIPVSQIEGFVRQIIGWREYMRGIYWSEMPGFKALNFFGHHRPLPEFYWTGETKMACMRDAIGNSLTRAYAHHIQRLMLTGNFAMLSGTDPDAVEAWYLGIYIDAVEWVETPNTRGMSQFADGGIVGTKPYAASANYIHKMSNYCGSCHYEPKIRTGITACPFNTLYWHFHHRHRPRLAQNPRIGMVYRILDKMTAKEKNRILSHAENCLSRVDEL
jgi:deoxyribodipyrimidine photolyase-related protein